MRVNKFVARATGLSRRAADQAIADGRVSIDNRLARAGEDVSQQSLVKLDNQPLESMPETITLALNKPVGYVCSRNGQGSHTVYELLPTRYHQLKLVGRLDKDSSGLILLTNDGQLANLLTHPRYGKEKIYEVRLNEVLEKADRTMIEHGIEVDDYTSRLRLKYVEEAANQAYGRFWQVTLRQGRNRQIRRTFEVSGYTVVELRRIQFGPYTLDNLKPGEFLRLTN